MSYKISICYPDQEEIELREEIVSSEDAYAFFANYPWSEQIELSNIMPQDDVRYSPSIRFTNELNKRFLELTADEEDNKIMFSLWYGRPKTTKIFFGLLGEKEVIKVIDKWSFDKETSLSHLSSFLDEKYEEMEIIMKG